MLARKTTTNYFKVWLALGFSLFLQPTPAMTQVIGVQGFYAQSDDFWDQVDRLKESADTAQILSQLFEDTQGKVTEGMASGGIYYASSGSPLGLSFMSRGIVALETEAVAGGYVRNRISPEIEGYNTWGVSLSAGAQRHLPVNESGWGLIALTTSGIGKQELIRGEVTSYLSEAIESESTLFYQGFDLGVEFQSLWSDHLRFRSSYYFLPTYFYSQAKDDEHLFEISDGKWRLRWRTQFEVTTRTSSFGSGALELGTQAIGGPQPIPMAVLPRIWDGIHEIDPTPSAGALIGLGGVARVVSQSRRYSLEAFGGFYGGYWGAGAALQIGWLHLRGGTFGVEQSSNYQLRETRLNFIDGGLSYVW